MKRPSQVLLHVYITVCLYNHIAKVIYLVSQLLAQSNVEHLNVFIANNGNLPLRNAIYFAAIWSHKANDDVLMMALDKKSGDN